MAIEAGVVLPSPDRSRPTPGLEQTVAERKPGTTEPKEVSDRIELSASTLRRIFGKRVPGILRSAAGRPEKLIKEAAKELGKQYRNAIRDLRRAGLLDRSEAKALRQAYQQARRALKESAGDGLSTTQVEASSESRVSESRSYSLEIQTAEGDRVAIRLERSDQQGYSVQLGADDDGSASFSGRFESSTSSTLTFRVEGELNEDERAAIDDLVGRVDELAARFFEGDTQAALEYALEFGLEDPQIAGFSVNLGHTREVYAAQSYSVVQSLAGPVSETDTSPVVDLLSELRTLGSQTRLETLFVDARSLVQNVFRGAVETDSRIDASVEGETLLERLERLLEVV